MSKGYKAYKSRLRVEFSHKCGYCEIREPEIGGAKSFHIDHYKPQQLFPYLINDYDNLIYSCRNCNGYKGSYWPTLVDRLLKKIIINPRENKIEKHINKSSPVWVGITPEGKWTVKKLRLDSYALRQIREDRTRIERKISELALRVDKWKEQLKRSIPNNERNKLETAIEEETKNIASFKRKIFGPMD